MFPNEVLFRTIPNTIGYYSKDMGNWLINPNAFEPRTVDTDGISLFREDFVSEEELARLSGHPHGVRVSRVQAKQFEDLKLSLKPSPVPDQPPGHVVVPEMPFVKKTPQTKIQKQTIQDLAQRLAQLASKNRVYVPPGLQDPVTKSKG